MFTETLNKPRFVGALSAATYFIYYCVTYTDWHFLDTVNLIIHEAGHVMFSFFGEFIHILGGSLFQILVPIVFVLYFYRLKDYFSASLLLFWVGQNIINVSVYARDAIVMQLPLLGGDSVGHDWNNILVMLNALKYTYKIASGLHILGIIIISFAICLSLTYSFVNTKDR